MRKPTPEKLAFARKLRLNMTPAEKALWARLRKGQLGQRFVRQQVVRGYIADFYCHKAKLAVEVDGPYHDYQALKDATRDMAIAQEGIRVLRVTNAEVESGPEGVLARVKEALDCGPLVNNNGRPRCCPPTNGVPVGLIIRDLRRKGYNQREAVALAFKIAQKRANKVKPSKRSVEGGRGLQGEGETVRGLADVPPDCPF